MTSVFNRYYDPTTDQFLSVDPMVARTNQSYAFVNDSPLNLDDPLGLRIAETGSAGCGIQQSGTKVRAIECNGQTSGGGSDVGLQIVTPTLVMTVPFGVITTSSSVTFSGSSNVTVGNDGITVAHGNGSVHFGNDGTASGSFGLPGAAGLNYQDGGLSATISTEKVLGGHKVDVETTQTYYGYNGPSPSLSDYLYAAAGSAAIIATMWAGLRWAAYGCVRDLTVCLAK